MSKQTVLSILLSALWLAGTSAEAANSLHIDQDGNFNRAAILQATVAPFSDNNDATIDQEGSGNTAIIRQDADGNLAMITQVSPSGIGFDDGNQAEIQQSSNGGHIGSIAQEAKYVAKNHGRIGQNGDPGTHQEAHIVQVGFGNWAEIDQSLGGNSFSVVQVGWVSRISGIQQGTGNQARVTQGEKGNSSGKYPKPDVSCEYCDATVNQLGDYNDATIVQKGPDGFVGVDLLASIVQTGNLNSAAINQVGSFNDAFIVQTGNENTATIDQLGNGNEGSITQNGNNNEFHLTQYNDKNSFTIEQTGGASASMTQYGNSSVTP